MQAFQSLREAREGASGAVTASKGLRPLGILKGSFKASFGAGAEPLSRGFGFRTVLQAFQSLREAHKGASGAVTALEGLKTTLGIHKGSFKASRLGPTVPGISLPLAAVSRFLDPF